MKILFIHRYCGLGGVTTTVRNRYLAFREKNIIAEFLALKDSGGMKVLQDTGMKTYLTEDRDEIEKIILDGEYDFISSIDTPQIYDLLDEFSFDINILCEIHASREALRKYIQRGKIPSGVRGFIVPSRAFKSRIEKELNPSFTVHVIHTPVDARFLSHDAVEMPHTGKKVIGWIGRLNELKNWSDALSIYEGLISKRDDIELFVVGTETPLKRELFLNEAIRRNLLGKIRWLPFIRYEKIHYFYRLIAESGGCLLSTSKDEAQPMIVIEAMAFQCPVVASDIDAHRELLDGGQRGSLYSGGHIDEGVWEVMKIIDDISYRNRVIEQAYDKVMSTFTPEKVVNEWQNLLQSLKQKEPLAKVCIRHS